MLLLICPVMLCLALGSVVWWYCCRDNKAGSKNAVVKLPPKPPDPLRPAAKAYNTGDYKAAETEALRIIKAASSSKDPTVRKDAVRAHYVLAFSAARMKDMEEARERFAVLKEEAAKLPDKGKQDSEPGVMSPTLEEEGAYQHAVCTAALGDKQAAIKEYTEFIRNYPESPLLSGAILRIQRLNNGKIPEDIDQVWQEAKKIAQEREKERQARNSMCGPECLAELLRRSGKKADVEALAKEMGTSEHGTSLKGLADAAKKHGYTAEGVQLTQKGLSKQPMPMIALVHPGHYVLVENVSRWRVTIWDPNGKGQDKPGTKRYSIDEWEKVWHGIGLTLQPKPASKLK